MEEGCDLGDYGAGGAEAVALAFEVSAVRTDWFGGGGLAWREGGGGLFICYRQSFCMSIITSAVVLGESEPSWGHAYGVAKTREVIVDGR